jgi:hypothetical protein
MFHSCFFSYQIATETCRGVILDFYETEKGVW